MSHEPGDELSRLADLIVEALDTIDAALEEGKNEAHRAAHAKVAEAQRLFETLTKAHPEAERRFGRRLTDLRRRAADLPALGRGRETERAADAGVVPFIERRVPGKSHDDELRRMRPAEGLTIGGEVDAWCGGCGGLHTHNIVAMVDGQPKAVICQVCGRRHNFRTSPARGPKGDAAAAQGATKAGGRTRRVRTPEEIEAERRDRERMELRRELAEATDVRSFSPKDRYRAGEIIEHPEFGRGRIENVLRASLLVRFGTGLRPLDLG